ncbi:hypothetical protein CN540_24060, partial [Bacillus toyonensis]
FLLLFQGPLEKNNLMIQLNIDKACFDQIFFKTRFFYLFFYQGLLSSFNQTLFKSYRMRVKED